MLILLQKTLEQRQGSFPLGCCLQSRLVGSERLLWALFVQLEEPGRLCVSLDFGAVASVN